ncbi:MAG TPA: hypothetical protein VHH88_07590 [Verrucomicrobiae bacterium]|nr:hypothetical protein [Verrucomicrobiae bacterium]
MDINACKLLFLRRLGRRWAQWSRWACWTVFLAGCQVIQPSSHDDQTVPITRERDSEKHSSKAPDMSLSMREPTLTFAPRPTIVRVSNHALAAPKAMAASERKGPVLASHAPAPATEPRAVLTSAPAAAEPSPAATTESVHAKVEPPAASAPEPAPSLVIKGSPRPRVARRGRLPLVLSSVLVLSGVFSLVGWGFVRKQREMLPGSAPEKDELLRGPGLLVKESTIGREKIPAIESSFPTET